MPTQPLIAHFLNHLFAGPVDAVMNALHVSPKYPQAPIPSHIAMELLVVVFLLAFFVLVRMTLSVETPGTIQHLAEMTHEFASSQGEQIIGHGFERYSGYLSVLFLFILLCNLMGLVPGLESPTANPTVPLGLALVTWVYYHFHGFRTNGIGYVKHFMGPVWWLSWLLFPIEVVSDLARILSLTVRLFANMFAGDLLTMAFFSLIPVGVPLLFLALHLGVACIQAYVFMLLAAIYLSLATAHDAH